MDGYRGGHSGLFGRMLICFALPSLISPDLRPSSFSINC
jgi:hypothetical protein